jgi:membrane protein insertase Oxa1/YidC/SpoIIIJ
MLWSGVIEILRGSLFALAHFCGGSFGAAILLASAAMRVALVPITFAATRRRLIQEQKLRDIAPQIEALKKRHAKKPEDLAVAMQTLYADHGVAFFDRKSVFSGLASLPPGAALYAAVRGAATKAGGFLWIADLAKPDRVLAAGASLLAGMLAWATAGHGDAKPAAQLIPVLVTATISLVVLWHLSAGVALYSVSNSIVGAVERAIAQRTLRSSNT